MAQSTTAIIIMGTALVLFMIPRIPLSITALGAMLAMVLFGIVPASAAFAGFSNSATLLLAGMLIIGRACQTTGLAEKFGKVICRMAGVDEKKFVMMLFLLAFALGIFLNGAIVVPLLMTIVDGIVMETKGQISRKHTYFPIGMAATLGNNMTTIGSSSTIAALAIYYSAGYETVGLFAPMMINLPPFLLVLAYYYFFGYRWQQKAFDFEENPLEEPVPAQGEGKPEKPMWKMAVTGLTLAGVTAALIAGLDMGVCALIGGAVVIVTGCVGEKEAYRSISWQTIIVVAASIGFSAGFTASGAGEVVATSILNVFGRISDSPFMICAVIFCVTNLISNVMSDNAAVAIMVPIAISLAHEMGIQPIAFVLAAASGSKDAIGTPLAVSTMTMLQSAGYRFKDYVKVAGIVDVMMVIAGCLMMKLLYFM